MKTMKMWWQMFLQFVVGVCFDQKRAMRLVTAGVKKTPCSLGLGDLRSWVKGLPVFVAGVTCLLWSYSSTNDADALFYMGVATVLLLGVYGGYIMHSSVDGYVPGLPLCVLTTVIVAIHALTILSVALAGLVAILALGSFMIGLAAVWVLVRIGDAYQNAEMRRHQ